MSIHSFGKDAKSTTYINAVDSGSTRAGGVISIILWVTIYMSAAADIAAVVVIVDYV